MIDPELNQQTEPLPKRWWVAIDGASEGPYGQAYIVAALHSGQLQSSTLICLAGTEQWRAIGEWLEFRQQMTPTPPPPPPQLGSVAPEFRHPLINSELPTMANWICVYCIVVIPVMWILNSILLLTAFTNGSTDAGDFIGQLIYTAIAAALLIGGLRLRDLRVSGCTIIKASIWVRLGLTVVGLLFILGGHADNSPPESVQAQPGMAGLDVFVLLIELSARGFEVASLIWLHRYGKSLSYTRR